MGEGIGCEVRCIQCRLDMVRAQWWGSSLYLEARDSQSRVVDFSMNSMISRRAPGRKDMMRQFTDSIHFKTRVPMGQKVFIAGSLIAAVSMLCILCTDSKHVWYDSKATVLVLHPNATLNEDRLDAVYRHAAAHNTSSDWLLVIGSEDFDVNDVLDEVRPLFSQYARHTVNMTLTDRGIVMNALRIMYDSMLTYHPLNRWHVTVFVSHFERPLMKACTATLTRDFHLPWVWDVRGVATPPLSEEDLKGLMADM